MDGTVEVAPSLPGTYDGELSPGGQWRWQGTGTPDDKWVSVQPSPGEVAPLAAPAPGTVIPAATTIDTIFTTVFGTRSSDISATPTYTWAGPFSIVANWPGLMTPQNIGNNSQMMARFEMRQMAPTTISP